MRPSLKQSQPEPLEKNVDHLLEECRMVLPGVQALFGFQLIAVFSDPFFEKLTRNERMLHLASLVMVAIAVALLMAPAAYHRQAEPERVSERFIAYSSRMLMAAMVPLTVALSLDVYLIARTILERAMPAALVGVLVLGTLTGLWFVLPWSMRGSRGRRRA